MKMLYAYMKNAVVVFAASFWLAGCEIETADFSPVTGEKVVEYSKGVVADHVAAPQYLLSLMDAFDMYIQLPESEKQNNSMFYGKVSLWDRNEYSFTGKVNNNGRMATVSVHVNTGGLSISAPSAVWKFSSVIVNAENHETSFQEETMLVKDPDKEMWTFKGTDFETQMTYFDDETGVYAFHIATSGSERADNGVVASFETGSDGIYLRKNGSSVVEERYEGTLDISITRGKKVLNTCKALFRPGYVPRYTVTQ